MAFSRAHARLSFLGLLVATGAGTLVVAPANAAQNCLQPENVPYDLTHTLSAVEQAAHDQAIVACQQRQREIRQQSQPISDGHGELLPAAERSARNPR